MAKTERENDIEFKSHNILTSVLLSPDGQDDGAISEDDLFVVVDNWDRAFDDSEYFHQSLIKAGLTEDQYQLYMRCATRHQEETLEDIAANLGIEVNALNLRLDRIRKKIKKLQNNPKGF